MDIALTPSLQFLGLSPNPKLHVLGRGANESDKSGEALKAMDKEFGKLRERLDSRGERRHVAIDAAKLTFGQARIPPDNLLT